MSVLVYFVPSKSQTWSAEILAKAELSHAFDSHNQCAAAYFDRTPLGKGFLVADKDAFGTDRSFEFGKLDDWQCGRYDASEAPYHCRRYDSGTITPLSLARRKMIPGLDLDLADGQVWHVPVASVPTESFSRKSVLPHKVKLTSDGWQANGAVLDHVKRLDEIGAEWWDLWWPPCYAALLEGETSWDAAIEESPYDLAAEVLGFNYRVGSVECSVLGLFDSHDNASRVLIHCVDGLEAQLMVMAAVAKKNAAESENSNLPVGASA